MLIENWRSAHKYLTVQLAALLAVVSQAYDYLPMVKEYVPQSYVTWIAIAILVARIVAQPKMNSKTDECPKEAP